jgi:hypothetical protein
VVYVGQQTVGTGARRHGEPVGEIGRGQNPRRSEVVAFASFGARAMTRKSSAPVAKPGATCSAAFVNAARGRKDAADAIRKTTAEGFAPGSVIFLDIERMESIPQRMREY